MLKAKDLHERSLEDLKELEKSLRGDTFQNRIKNFTNRLDDTSSMRKTRQDLARVLTVLAHKAQKASGAGAAEAPSAAGAQKTAARAPKPAKAGANKKAAAKPAGEAKPKKAAAKKTTKTTKTSEAK